jgi:dienelactone hydrolase
MKKLLSCSIINVLLAVASFVGANAWPACGSNERSAPRADDLQLREGLAIAPVGRYGRSAVREDAVEALIVTGKWSAPKAGDAVALPDGSTRTWEPIAAGDDGWVRGRALGGGYVHFAVPSQTEQVMSLDAAGHSMVYVNGEPRMGDLYSNGWVRVPVRLRAGANDFLFHVARGQLRAKLVTPRAAAQFDVADLTLPDLIVGQAVDTEAAVVVQNCSGEPMRGLALESTLPGGDPVRTLVPDLLPLGVRKVGFRLAGPAPDAEGETKMELKLLQHDADSGKRTPLDSAALTFALKLPAATHKRTFRSAIDGSVQYFAVVPEKGGESRADGGGPEHQRPGLILTLHGAGVEAIGQAACYSPKPGVVTVAATNRRPFGFDWEDWGRLDAIEVLEHAQRVFDTDPRRTYLTGHSMGGHGTWHVGVTLPDRFAAIGPSAGWVSMFSYAGARRGQPQGGNAPSARMAELLNRCMTPSDTLALSRNYQQHGVYVLHGEKDDNVPVAQARTMRQQLAEFHSDFAYHEEPGQGHWWGKDLAEYSKDGRVWGTACVDWPPMFNFFASRRIPAIADVRHVEFVTASPGVSAQSHWATIEAQVEQFKPSSVSIDHDPKACRFSGKTENVARLALDVGHLTTGGPIHVELDGDKLADIAWPETAARNNQGRRPNGERSMKLEARIWLSREDGKWLIGARPPASLKGPNRSGPFKDAFRNRVVFVYATRGTPDENAWSLAKARYDAETFWYRGNGSIDVIADTEFDAGKETDRNVIIYGNAEMNRAWQPLLGDSPVQVLRSRIQIGDRVELGDDLCCLFVRPRPGSDTGTVGVVSGSGVTGMRLSDRLPYFVSGVAYPDCIVFDSEILTKGVAGVHAAGFFGNDWRVASGEFVWRD